MPQESQEFAAGHIFFEEDRVEPGTSYVGTLKFKDPRLKYMTQEQIDEQAKRSLRAIRNAQLRLDARWLSKSNLVYNQIRKRAFLRMKYVTRFYPDDCCKFYKSYEAKLKAEKHNEKVTFYKNNPDKIPTFRNRSGVLVKQKVQTNIVDVPKYYIPPLTKAFPTIVIRFTGIDPGTGRKFGAKKPTTLVGWDDTARIQTLSVAISSDRPRCVSIIDDPCQEHIKLDLGLLGAFVTIIGGAALVAVTGGSALMILGAAVGGIAKVVRYGDTINLDINIGTVIAITGLDFGVIGIALEIDLSQIQGLINLGEDIQSYAKVGQQVYSTGKRVLKGDIKLKDLVEIAYVLDLNKQLKGYIEHGAKIFKDNIDITADIASALDKIKTAVEGIELLSLAGDIGAVEFVNGIAQIGKEFHLPDTSKGRAAILAQAAKITAAGKDILAPLTKIQIDELDVLVKPYIDAVKELTPAELKEIARLTGAAPKGQSIIQRITRQRKIIRRRSAFSTLINKKTRKVVRFKPTKKDTSKPKLPNGQWTESQFNTWFKWFIKKRGGIKSIPFRTLIGYVNGTRKVHKLRLMNNRRMKTYITKEKKKVLTLTVWDKFVKLMTTEWP